ncbi:MAG TPA: hypothetical protein VLG27_04195, partial [Candidatus Saccharimonadia bacterium]|nr:hypothetical protein [Candidatus Saccharimonadia bacterium]
MAFSGLANALTVHWNPVGSYTVDFTCTSGCAGTYEHSMDITHFNSSNGNLSGTGHYNADPSITWDLTGSLTDSNVTLHILYTGSNAGYTVDATGTVANDGTMSGTASSNASQAFTWKTTAGAALASSIRGLGAKDNLKPEDCSLTKKSKEVVDVNFKLVNDYDSGVGGNAWANDTINRRLNVWNVGGSTYCAIVKDQGTIVTFAGESPNGTGTVGAGVKGDMHGGYRTTVFTGNLSGNANYHTHGNLGTFNLQCTDAYNCPGAHPSYSSYFSST